LIRKIYEKRERIQLRVTRTGLSPIMWVEYKAENNEVRLVKSENEKQRKKEREREREREREPLEEIEMRGRSLRLVQRVNNMAE